MHYKLARVGAKWWIEQMKKRCIDTCPTKIKTSNFGNNIDIIDVPLSEKFSRFEKMLADEIQTQLTLYHYIDFGCYYSPSKLLMKIAETTGISSDFFPIPAHIEITNNTIFVSADNQDSHELNISAYQL